ncbi:MAG TPA: glycoside hydrolase family 15 protein [Propionibacteriaceae bacterium]|nr:glycoside hydrolase family 15 protein [Propionibacteriaceae bacterium]
MSNTAIADHALLSDRHSSALVDRSGSVEWLSFPRFDSPSVFGRLLSPDAGHWSITPSGDWTSARRYLDRTLVLETTFTTATGVLVLTDLLALGPNNGGHRLGTNVPHLLVRRVACNSGSVEVNISYAPRPEYGLVVPLLAHVDGGVTARGGAEWLVLTAPLDLQLERGTAYSRLTLNAGQTIHLALHRSTLEQTPAHIWSESELAATVNASVADWQSWSDIHQTYDGPWRDLVWTSGRVLQGLSFQPSGAIVAAATTSLPEVVGGERNWDYRYSWVRDASFTMQALWVAACPDEASNFFEFMTTAAASSIGPHMGLQIMFGVGGEHDLTERELHHLTGWQDSRPVRVGNGAWNQRQIDVYGEVLGAAAQLSEHIDTIDEDTRRFLIACANAAAASWTEKDRGIWEVRGDPQHFVYSKVMCWVALDRAIALSDLLHAADRVDSWKQQRDQIWETVMREAWSNEAGAFTQYIGSTALDAANLMMAIVGFLPATDPRMLATIDAIEERLTDDRGLVYRYRNEDAIDGLAGDEGTFLLCTFWLAEALALADQVDRARAVFERAAAFANDLGLLAEEVNADTGELLGNFPQAFSHIGLVNAAWEISEAERRAVP